VLYATETDGDMTSLQFYPRIKNGCMAGIIFRAFHVFFSLYVMLQPSVKREGVTGRTTLVGKLVARQTAPGSHSEALACRAAKRV